jgi:hypothetical protein
VGSPRRLAAVALVTLVTLALLLPAGPAAAHVAIRLDVMAPQANQTIGPDSELVIVARPMLLDIPELTFTPTLDGRPLDPATGRPADRPVPLPIRVNQTRRIPLRGLAPGSHVLAISYRPDTDAPTLATTVPVTVTAGRSRLARLALPAGLAVLLLAAAAAVIWRRPDRTPRHPGTTVNPRPAAGCPRCAGRCRYAPCRAADQPVALSAFRTQAWVASWSASQGLPNGGV